MSEISQCISRIQKYKRLKADVKSVMAKLSLAINDTNDINLRIENRYLVNDNPTPIVSRTKELKSDMKTTYNYLKHKILPEIDAAISGLNKKKDRLEKEE